MYIHIQSVYVFCNDKFIRFLVVSFNILLPRISSSSLFSIRLSEFSSNRWVVACFSTYKGISDSMNRVVSDIYLDNGFSLSHA